MKTLSFYFQKAKPYLKNKYVIICFVFAIFTFSSVRNRIYNNMEINRLEKEMEMYKKKTQDIEKIIEGLRANKKSVEKLAREEYGMKQTDEDVFVVE